MQISVYTCLEAQSLTKIRLQYGYLILVMSSLEFPGQTLFSQNQSISSSSTCIPTAGMSGFTRGVSVFEGSPAILSSSVLSTVSSSSHSSSLSAFGKRFGFFSWIFPFSSSQVACTEYIRQLAYLERDSQRTLLSLTNFALTVVLPTFFSVLSNTASAFSIHFFCLSRCCLFIGLLLSFLFVIPAP